MERPAIKPRPLPPAVKRHRFLMSVANHSIAIAVAIIFVTPFFFVIITALMTQRQALNFSLIPHPLTFSNFTTVLKSENFFLYTGNTVLYAGLATIGTVLSCVPVAYALARMRWKFREPAFLLVLSTLMLPSQVTIVPLYIIFVRLGWTGSLKPLIVPAFFGDAFTIFLLRQFFKTIPEELSDAARVDGASEWQILTRVVIPLAKPAIAAVALFQFLYCWNDFFDPLLYAASNSKAWTLSVSLANYSDVHRGVLWNLQMAASLIFMIPVVIIFFLAQRVFVEGVTLTGVKG